MKKLIHKILQLGIGLCKQKELLNYVTQLYDKSIDIHYEKINYLGPELSDLEFINKIILRLYTGSKLSIWDINKLEWIYDGRHTKRKRRN